MMSSSSSSSSPIVTAMPDKQPIPTDSELDAIAPKATLHCNSLIQFPRPGFINDIDAMPAGYWWPWPTVKDAVQDLFPDWIASRQQLSPTQYQLGYKIPLTADTLAIPVVAAVGAGAGLYLGGRFARHFRLGYEKTLLARTLFAGGLGGSAFGLGVTMHAVGRYHSFFQRNPNGPVFNPPLSYRQSYQGLSKDGEIIKTPGMPTGLYQSPFDAVSYQEEKGIIQPSEAKVYRALLRKLDKEGVEAAKLRNAENKQQHH